MKHIVAGLLLGAVLSACGCHEPHNRHSRTMNDNHHAHGHDHQRTPEELDQYIARMEAPERTAWQQPDAVIRRLQLRRGERVADVGCGPGYFTLPLARAVGPDGVVWAVDIEPEMLERIRERAATAKLNNIRPIVARPDDPLLPAGQVETLLIVNTYHHFNDRSAYLRHLRRALSPSGRVVIVDFVPKSREERGFGPPLEMQLSRETVDGELRAAGFEVAAEHHFLPEQYFVEYRSR